MLLPRQNNKLLFTSLLRTTNLLPTRNDLKCKNIVWLLLSFFADFQKLFCVCADIRKNNYTATVKMLQSFFFF